MKNLAQVKNALWGLFISDSLSMPVHWYYKREYIKKDFGKITGYNDALHPHPESFMVANTYFPNVETAKKLNRRYDILHQHSHFYNTTYSYLAIETKVHDGEHANMMPELDERYHYHHGLKAGENTLGANLVRVLMRSVIKNKGYNQDSFLDDFIDYMTAADTNNDPYLEIYLRDWFENYSEGFPPALCAQSQRQRWSIGSHGGIIRPLVLSLTTKSAFEGLGVAVSHQNLTHSSQNISSALGSLVPLLSNLLNGNEAFETLKKSSQEIALIKIHGEELSKIYFSSNGPGNIPKDQMWKIHTEFSGNYLSEILPSATDESMITKRFATSCYPEHGVPLIYYFLYKNKFDFLPSLLDNANAGGDNVHRGMILGMLVGSATKEIPASLKEGLVKDKEIENEIENFVKFCEL